MTLTLVIAALIILVIALLLIVIRHFRKTRSEAPKARLEPPRALTSNNPAAISPTPQSFDTLHWAQANGWLLAGQADDRRPVNGSIAMSTGSASARRSVARRTHQVNHKEWSKQRHD